MMSYFLFFAAFGFALIKRISNGDGVPMHWLITWGIGLIFSIAATVFLGL